MENRKVAYTKRTIREVLVALLREKPADRVTVTELCERADINRSTFYRYYTDVSDLMQKAENELYEDLFRSLRIEAGDAPYDIVLRALRSVRKNRDLYAILLTEREDKVFIERLIAPVHAMLDGSFEPVRPGDEARYQLEYDFLIGGVTAVWRTWLGTGCSLPPEDVAQLVDRMIESTFQALQLLNRPAALRPRPPVTASPMPPRAR